MTIVEQAENELRLLMLCKPSTARALIDEVKRLRAELAGKRTSPEVSTQMECPDCHAVTRWSRHLDLDCHTIATLLAELETANLLVKRYDAALEWMSQEQHSIHSYSYDCGNSYGVYSNGDRRYISEAKSTPLAAIESAMKEKP